MSISPAGFYYYKFTGLESQIEQLTEALVDSIANALCLYCIDQTVGKAGDTIQNWFTDLITRPSYGFEFVGQWVCEKTEIEKN